MNTFFSINHSSHKTTGWKAEVILEFKNRFGKSVLGSCSRKGPLTFQRPFYPEKEVCHLYLLHPPGGIVGGDSIDLDINIKKDAHALITTPGATKFYRSQGLTAYQLQHFDVASTGVLEWFPQETILFPGAKAEISTRVDLDGNAVFLGWEILCLGRPASQMDFDTGSLKSRFCVYKKGIPLFIDQLNIDNDMDSKAMRHCNPGLQGFAVSAVFVVAGIPPDMFFDKASEIKFDTATVSDKGKIDTATALKGITRINNVLVARYLGHDPEEAKTYFISIWNVVRQVMLNRAACIPRIWAT